MIRAETNEELTHEEHDDSSRKLFLRYGEIHGQRSDFGNEWRKGSGTIFIRNKKLTDELLMAFWPSGIIGQGTVDVPYQRRSLTDKDS